MGQSGGPMDAAKSVSQRRYTGTADHHHKRQQAKKRGFGDWHEDERRRSARLADAQAATEQVVQRSERIWLAQMVPAVKACGDERAKVMEAFAAVPEVRAQSFADAAGEQ